MLLYARLKKREVLWEHVRRAGSVQSICPLNNLNSFYCIIIKLCKNVCWQNISAKFDNQPEALWSYGPWIRQICQNKPSPLCNLNIFQWIIIRLCDIVCWHNLFAKSNNQRYPMKHFRVLALEVSKIARINLVISVTCNFFSIDHHQTWCMKLSDNVCWHYFSTTFNNQPDLMKHFGVMALIELRLPKLTLCTVVF